VKAASQERDTIELRKRNEKRRRSESAFALLELSKPTTIEDQTNTYVEESNCRACQTDITAEYFTETLPEELGIDFSHFAATLVVNRVLIFAPIRFF